MLSGLDCSGFGWDPKKKIITTEKAVWDAYILFESQGSRLCWENLCLSVRAGTSSLGCGTGLKTMQPDKMQKLLEMWRRNLRGQKAQGHNLNVENVRDEVDHCVSFSLASRKHLKTSKAHQEEGEEMKIQKSLENLQS
ncbi:hypothetical protein WN943_007708 [Citrus x changshan-huyou]